MSDTRRCGIHGDDTTSGRCASCDREFVRQALSAAYVAIHRTLDRQFVNDAELSDVQSRLACALRAVGSSGAEALGISNG